jgi:exonuclease III
VAVLLTWNVAGRVRGASQQVSAVLAGDWDVVCLQEITPTTAGAWRAALEGAGLHVATSAWPVAAEGSRRLAVLIAARAPVAPLPPLADAPWPERHLAVRTVIDGVEAEIHTLHAPLSQKAEGVKVRTLEALHAALVAGDGTPRIVSGDFNTPRYESREGEITTFARTQSGKLRPEYGERHDRAELLLVHDLPRRGWRDAFRALHGYDRRDRSYLIKPPGYGWRLDHVICSPSVRPIACDYLHEWRELKLSDHSGMWAEVEAGTG